MPSKGPIILIELDCILRVPGTLATRHIIMGCLLSLHFGIRESERRQVQRREQQDLVNSSAERNIGAIEADDMIVFCTHSDSFSTTNIENGKTLE